MALPIITDRLVIERFTETHLYNPNYLGWLSDRDNLKALNLISYILNPVSINELRDYYEAFLRRDRDTLLAVSMRDTGQFVGTAALREIGYKGLFDLGILIGEKTVRGRGIAREVISAVTQFAFSEMQARKICSSFAENNIAVMLAFIKNGYKIEGLQRDQQVTVDGELVSRYIVGLLARDRTLASD